MIDMKKYAEIAQMTDEEKGAYLLNSVRHIVQQSGSSEEVVIYMMVNRGCMVQGLSAELETVRGRVV